MVALPYYNVCYNSFLKCPNWAWVSFARAVICCVLSVYGRNVLLWVWIFTVKWSSYDMSGSYAASALRSTCWRAGAVGGAKVCSAIRAMSSHSIWSPTSISSCCDVVNSSLLLSPIGIWFLQFIQKSTTHQ